MSKFIIELINCYKNSDEFNVKDSNEKKVLQKIEDYCNKFIENNLSNLEEIGLNLNLGDLISKNIDEIYAEIIISLIINNKFHNFDKIKRIVEQLELKSIIITKKMYKKLSDALSLNNQYMKNYILSSIDDLLNDQKKLNFFYILLEYIFKESFYIYNLDIFFKASKIVKINNCDNKLKSNKKNEIIVRYINVINKLRDSNYYSNKSNNNSSTLPSENFNKNLSSNSINYEEILENINIENIDNFPIAFQITN